MYICFESSAGERNRVQSTKKCKIYFCLPNFKKNIFGTYIKFVFVIFVHFTQIHIIFIIFIFK